MLVNINALRRIFPENRRFFSPQLYKIFCFVCTRDERIFAWSAWAARQRKSPAEINSTGLIRTPQPEHWSVTHGVLRTCLNGKGCGQDTHRVATSYIILSALRFVNSFFVPPIVGAPAAVLLPTCCARYAAPHREPRSPRTGGREGGDT